MKPELHARDEGMSRGEAPAALRWFERLASVKEFGHMLTDENVAHQRMEDQLNALCDCIRIGAYTEEYIYLMDELGVSRDVWNNEIFSKNTMVAFDVYDTGGVKIAHMILPYEKCIESDELLVLDDLAELTEFLQYEDTEGNSRLFTRTHVFDEELDTRVIAEWVYPHDDPEELMEMDSMERNIYACACIEFYPDDKEEKIVVWDNLAIEGSEASFGRVFSGDEEWSDHEWPDEDDVEESYWRKELILRYPHEIVDLNIVVHVVSGDQVHEEHVFSSGGEMVVWCRDWTLRSGGQSVVSSEWVRGYDLGMMDGVSWGIGSKLSDGTIGELPKTPPVWLLSVDGSTATYVSQNEKDRFGSVVQEDEGGEEVSTRYCRFPSTNGKPAFIVRLRSGEAPTKITHTDDRVPHIDEATGLDDPFVMYRRS